ncbi:MAG: fibronectin type III domain-containing protein [Desulfotomaculaceae bacterium]|nr:fibronectin type III domain-containing protein [Desulfotomaculaceae bacterium]
MKRIRLLVMLLLCPLIIGVSWLAPAEAAEIAAPSNLNVVAVSASQINLTWTDNSNNESGFRIECKTGNNSFAEIAVVDSVTTFTDTRLAADTTYSYRVRAFNSSGYSAYSNIDSATTSGTVPAAPTGLSATAESSSRINLTWKDNATNETGFKIERREPGGSYIQVTTVKSNATSYNDTGLDSNTRYDYRVRAYNSHGNSGYSNEDSATTTGEAVPAAPSDLSASATSYSWIYINWADNSHNETGFIIERKKAGGTYSQIGAVYANTTNFTDTGLAGDTRYYYRVRAYNAYGHSDYSNEDSVVTADRDIPETPSDLSATALSSSRIRITWDDNSNNETGFKIERRRSGGTYSQIDTVDDNTTSYTDTGLSSDTRYYYRVRAYNASGNSDYSNEDSAVTTDGDIPETPSDLSATALSSSRIKITWEDNSNNETGFRIERKRSGGTYSLIDTVDDNTTSYTDSGLSGNTRYYYRVRAYNANGNSGYSNEDSAATVSTSEIIIKLNIGKANYYVNDQRRTMDTVPEIRESRTVLPIRYVAEALGASVAWKGSEQKVTINHKNQVIELWIGMNTARVNGKYMLIDSTNPNVTPFILPPGRTMLPLRFIAENMGAEVGWNQSKQEVTVTYPAP